MCTWGECCIKLVRLPQAKELPEARKEAWNRVFLRGFRGNLALLTP